MDKYVIPLIIQQFYQLAQLSEVFVSQYQISVLTHLSNFFINDIVCKTPWLRIF